MICNPSFTPFPLGLLAVAVENAAGFDGREDNTGVRCFMAN